MKKQIRSEFDSIGEIKVPIDKYWGAQTERALLHFQIGVEPMPQEVISALALIKKAAAITNSQVSKLSKNKAKIIANICDEISEGKFKDHFPLAIWQSGSATQTNMNMNEVIANVAKNKAKIKIHPNDDVNMSQSTNDIFPAAMHIATLILINNKLLPAIIFLRKELSKNKKKFIKVLKIGRTHLQDALPMTLGQEFSGYIAQIDLAIQNIKSLIPYLQLLSIGGTAIGTGLNAPKNFGVKVAKLISKFTGVKFKTAPNKFSLLASHDALSITSGALKTLATILFKITNDIRWLSCGPRCGLGELILPDNEPGSSIMPGKINPTQCEVMLMVCAQVIGNDAVVTFANSQGNFELNIFKPVIIHNILQAINLLSNACISFSKYALNGLEANHKHLINNVSKSLMLVTVLNPIIGYDKACKIAKIALKENLSLREANAKLGYLTEKEFNAYMQPKKML